MHLQLNQELDVSQYILFNTWHKRAAEIFLNRLNKEGSLVSLRLQLPLSHHES